MKTTFNLFSKNPLGQLVASVLVVSFTFWPFLSSAAFAQAQTSTTTYEYDGLGNVTKMTDPRGIATTNSYDTLDRLIQQVQPNAGLGNPTSNMTYDLQDRVNTVVDPRSLTTTYTNTGLGD
jgi:YD repeat-containing protein